MYVNFFDSSATAALQLLEKYNKKYKKTYHYLRKLLCCFGAMLRWWISQTRYTS